MTIQSYTVYCLEERADNKDFWTRVGKAWPHKTKSGFSISLNALPLNGRLIVMDDKDTKTAEKAKKGKTS